MKNTQFKLTQNILCFFFSAIALSQVGIGTTTPSINSSLTLGENNKGFLINRVALTATNLAAPLTAHETGMIVYNTATSGTAPNNVTPGLYINNGSLWEKLVPSSQISNIVPTAVEKVNTDDGTFTQVGSEFIWNAFSATRPSVTTTAYMKPVNGTISNIVLVPATNATASDAFYCTKNITSLKFYCYIQASTSNSNAKWRVNLFLNNVYAANFWGAPTNGTNNVRTTAVFEYGPIPANTLISVKIDKLDLPNSTQNQGSYFVVEYENN